MPATTTPFDDRRSRLERILALARLSLAVLAALVLRIDPLAVVTALPALPSLIMAYTLYSWAAAVAVAVVNRDIKPLGVILQCLDVGWAVLITSITAGPADAFFVFFVFVVVGAAYRWGFKESVATGLVTAALLLGQSSLASAGFPMLPAAGLWAHVVVRSGYAVGLAILIGYLAEEQHRARAQSAAAARVLAAVNLGGGLRASIDAMLRELMDTFQARAALLAFEEVGAGRLYLWELPERGGTVRLIERPLDENSRIAGRFRSGARVYRLRRRSPGGGADGRPWPPWRRCRSARVESGKGSRTYYSSAKCPLATRGPDGWPSWIQRARRVPGPGCGWRACCLKSGWRSTAFICSAGCDRR